MPVGYRVVLLAVLVAAGVRALGAVWHFTIDDAGISYAYAKHLAEGLGPVAAVGGPWIEGYSNPLWVFSLVPVHWLGLPMGEAAKVLGVVFFALGLAAGGAWLARADGRRLRGFGAVEAGFALAAVVCAELVVWVPAGLENALFTALLLGMIALDAREAEEPGARGWSGLCAFGLSITRPEAVMYAAPLVAIKLVQALRGREPRRQVRAAVLLFVVPLAVYHVGHYLVFHEVVPNTYYAKPSWHGGPEYLRSTALASGLAFALPLALAGLIGKWRLVLMPAWACVAGSAFVLYSGGDWMPHARFLSLFGACLLLLAARGVNQVARLVVGAAARMKARVRARREARSADGPGAGAPAHGVLPRELAALVLAAAVLVAWARYQRPRLVAIQRANWCHFCERLADTKRIQRMASRAGIASHSLVTQDFGGPSWLSDESFYPIDFLGLCDRSIVLIRGKRARGGVRNDFRFHQYLIHEQPTAPTWVFVPPNFWPGFDRSPEYRDYYELSPRLLPRARRDSFFALHRGELADYFPPIPPGVFQSVGDDLTLVGSGLFAEPGAGEGALAPGARALAVVSLVPRARRNGAEQVAIEVSAVDATPNAPAANGGATARSAAGASEDGATPNAPAASGATRSAPPANGATASATASRSARTTASTTTTTASMRLDRGIDALTGQLWRGEPLAIELPLVLPDAPARAYRVALRVSPAADAAGAPIAVPLGEFAAGSALPRYERVLPRYPAALPPPTEPRLRELRPAVTMAIEDARRAGRAAAADAGLSQRLSAIAEELDAGGQTEQAYLAAVWATQVDRSAWERLAEDVHRLRQLAMDDEHSTELILLRRYYASGTASELARLVAFYLAGRRALEADYFFRRWPGASSPDEVAPELREALAAELRAQLAGDVQGAAAALARVAFDPLGGAFDFESDALEGWQGDRASFRAGPQQRLRGLRGQHGQGVLTSGSAGESTRGALTSPVFRVEGRLLTALVGGGSLSQRVGVELRIDGEKPMPISGNDSENMWVAVWEVERFQGRSARLHVYDQSNRKHVSLDRVLLWR